jgi:hypothetical protein
VQEQDPNQAPLESASSSQHHQDNPPLGWIAGISAAGLLLVGLSYLPFYLLDINAVAAYGNIGALEKWRELLVGAGWALVCVVFIALAVRLNRTESATHRLVGPTVVAALCPLLLALGAIAQLAVIQFDSGIHGWEATAVGDTTNVLPILAWPVLGVATIFAAMSWTQMHRTDTQLTLQSEDV